jgi:dihydrofolate reductase
MKRLTSIVAMNHEGVIGCGNALPWRLKQDMQFFKQETIQQIVLMGRNTYDSLGQRCLPKRYNVVVSHFTLFEETTTCKYAHGIDDALFRATLAPPEYQETFVIGGASMYNQFAPYVDRYLVTIVNKNVPSADTFFETSLISSENDWVLECLGEARQDEVNEASFAIFELRSKHMAEIAERRRVAIDRARNRSMPFVRPLARRPVRAAKPENFALSIPFA